MDNNQPVIPDAVQSHHHLTLLLSILSLTVLVAGVFVYLNYTWEKSTAPEPVTTTTPKPFKFTYVPEALDIITIPDPEDTTSYDAAAYQTAVKKVGNTTITSINSPLEFMYKSQPFSAYLKTDQETANEFFPRLEELRVLAEHLNSQYNRPPLNVRQPNLIPTDAPAVSVGGITPGDSTYPFWPVIEAQLVTAIMVSLDAGNEALYQEQLSKYFNELLASGYIGQSDLDASNLLFFQYTTHAALYSSTPIDTTGAEVNQ